MDKVRTQFTLADQRQRIRIIDIVRGVAVLGIVTMNFPDMAYPEDLVLDFHATDPEEGWNYWAGVISEILFSGKMRGLFTLLFGVSAVLIIENLQQKMGVDAAAGIYFRRLFWLLIFGLVNAYVLLWWGDVLFKYALLGVLLFALRAASYRVLTLAVLACLLVLTLQPLAEYREMSDLRQAYVDVQQKKKSDLRLSPDDRVVVHQWRTSLDDLSPDRDSIEEERQIKSGHYLQIFKDNVDRVVEEQTVIFYKEDIWDMGLYMFLGIMLLRMGFFHGRVSRAVHLATAFLGTGIGLLVHTWLVLGIDETRLDPADSLFYLIFVDVGRLPFVLGYLSLIILMFRAERVARIGDWMVAVGRMALTNYLIQSVIGAFVFYGFGLALFDQMTRMHVAMLIVAVWAFQIVLSVFWMRLFYHGPLEWLWRSLTYWRVQALRR